MTGFGRQNTGAWNTKPGGSTWSTAQTRVDGTQISGVPTDSVSCMEFEERDRPLLAAGSWDGTIRIWEFDSAYRTPRAYLTWLGDEQNKQAILRLTFSDGPLYFVTTDGRVWSLDIASPSGQVLGIVVGLGHVTGLKYIRDIHRNFDKERPADKTTPHPGLLFCTANAFGPSRIGIIDIGQKKVVWAPEQPAKFVDLGLAGDHAYFATVGGPIVRLDLANGGQTLEECKVPISDPIGTVTCLTSLPGPDSGFMVGTLFGDVIMARVPATQTTAMGGQFFELLEKVRVAQLDTQNWTVCWAVNCVARSSSAPVVIAGAGQPYQGNGRIWLWDLHREVKTEIDIGCSAPVTACAVSPYGNVYAFATGYDWQFGVEKTEVPRYNPGVKIVVREVQFPEAK